MNSKWVQHEDGSRRCEVVVFLFFYFSKGGLLISFALLVLVVFYLEEDWGEDAYSKQAYKICLLFVNVS